MLLVTDPDSGEEHTVVQILAEACSGDARCGEITEVAVKQGDVVVSAIVDGDKVLVCKFKNESLKSYDSTKSIFRMNLSFHIFVNFRGFCCCKM